MWSSWPIVRAVMDAYRLPEEGASPLTGMVCCIFIMYYYSLHCNLAQSEDCSVISIVISYFHSLTVLRDEVNLFLGGTDEHFSCTVANYLVLSDPMTETQKAFLYLLGRWRDEFMSQ